jgi:hypothetical protein
MRFIRDRITRDPRDTGTGGGCSCTFSLLDVALDETSGEKRFLCPKCGAKLNPYDVAAWFQNAAVDFSEQLDALLSGLEAKESRAKSWQWFKRLDS